MSRCLYLSKYSLLPAYHLWWVLSNTSWSIYLLHGIPEISTNQWVSIWLWSDISMNFEPIDIYLEKASRALRPKHIFLCIIWKCLGVCYVIFALPEHQQCCSIFFVQSPNILLLHWKDLVKILFVSNWSFGKFSQPCQIWKKMLVQSQLQLGLQNNLTYAMIG